MEIEALQAENFDLSLTGFDESELAGFFDAADDAKDDDFDVDAELEKLPVTKSGDLWLLGNHMTGFDESELAGFFDAADDAKDDDFDVDAELEKLPVTKSGDLWLLGNHRLLCGDSIREESYPLLMNGKKANLVVTDPPYNVNYEGSAGKIQNDSMKEDAFEKFLLDAYTQMNAAMAEDASIYVFHSDSHGLAFGKAFEDAGFYLSGCCIWKKQSLVLGRSPYQWQHEPCLFGWKKNGLAFGKAFEDAGFYLSGCCIWKKQSLVLGRSPYQWQHEPCLFGWKKNGKHPWYSDRKQTTIWNYDKLKRNANHPTSKPLDLLGYPISNSSQENTIVIDTFGGSGSTMMACEQTNRICHMMELDEKYASVILRRYVEDTGDADNVYVFRKGERMNYADLVKEVGADE